MRRCVFSFLIPVIMLAGVSCSGTKEAGNEASKNPNEKISDGEKKGTVTADGLVYEGTDLTVVMPKTWKMIDFTGKDFEKMLEDTTKDPNYAGMGPAIKSMANNKQFKFFAFAPEYATKEFVANVNLLEIPMPPGVTADQVFKANQTQLAQMVKKELPILPVTVAGAEAAKFEWINTMGGREVETVTVIAVAKGQQAVFTFSFPKGKMASAKADVDKVISTISFK